MVLPPHNRRHLFRLKERSGQTVLGFKGTAQQLIALFCTTYQRNGIDRQISIKMNSLHMNVLKRQNKNTGSQLSCYRNTYIKRFALLFKIITLKIKLQYSSSFPFHSPSFHPPFMIENIFSKFFLFPLFKSFLF